MLAIHGVGRYHHGVQIAAAGDNAVLVELGEVSASELHAVAASVRRVQDVLACIPGHSSLYVICHGSPDRVAVSQAVRDPSPPGLQGAKTRRVLVSLASEDAPDLDEFLKRVGLGSSEFAARLAELRLTARYLGFRGGFAYLDGWPDEWAMPRRATSRPHVRKGSFGIAGNIAGFYPVDSPGGWNLLGLTDADLEHAIAPGDVLMLEPTLLRLKPATSTKSLPRLELEYAEVISAPLARVAGPADWGRIEYGVPPGGPFDALAAALANRAVGNAAEAPLLECAFTGPRLRFRRDAFFAWCGPDLAVRSGAVRKGEEVSIGNVSGGMRGYLAVGSAVVSVAQVTRDDRLEIRCIAGPHDIGLSQVECEVTPQLDRVGIRLQPLEPIRAEIPADLRSCGMQCGTIQLHPDGSLVAMGPDHPVTGGYLQPMTVATHDRWKLAQLAPGDRVRFVCVGCGD